MLGASFDSVEENAAFAQKNAFTFPLLCDVDRKIGLAYGACADAAAKWPSRVSFLIDENGKIARVYDKVDARNHPAQVLADVLDASS